MVDLNKMLSPDPEAGMTRMTSWHIAELVCKPHDEVKQEIDRLADSEVIIQPSIQDVFIANAEEAGIVQAYVFDPANTRDVFIVAARLSLEVLTGLVGRWLELEKWEAKEKRFITKLGEDMLL
jgi:phage regulator Rha-like protein